MSHLVLIAVQNLTDFIQWAPSQTAQMLHAENTLKPDDILSAIYLPQVQDYVSSLELRPAFPFP